MPDIFLYAIGSACAAGLLGLWQEFSAGQIPELKWVAKNEADKEVELVPSKRSVKQRIYYLIASVILGFFVGILINLFINGFLVERNLNLSAIWFCQAAGGFIMPNILFYLSRLNIEKQLCTAIKK